MRRAIHALAAAAMVAASSVAMAPPSAAGMPAAPAAATLSPDLVQVRDRRDRHYRPYRHYSRHYPRSYRHNGFWFGFPLPIYPRYCHVWYRGWDGRLYCRY